VENCWITRNTSYGYSIYEMSVFSPSTAICGENLLTQGFRTTAGWPTGCYAVRGNSVDLLFANDGTCSPSDGLPALSFVQDVSVPDVGTKYHLTIDVTNLTGEVDYVTLYALLNGQGAASYTPIADTVYDYHTDEMQLVGSTAGAGKIEGDFDVALDPNAVNSLEVFASAPCASGREGGCYYWLQHYTLGNVKLVKVQ